MKKRNAIKLREITIMEIGISTACFFSRMYTEEALAYIGKNGIRCVETFLDTPSEYTREFAVTLRETADEYGVNITAVHAMAQQFEPQLFSIGNRQRKDAWAVYESVLQAAEIMGASHYVFHGPANLLGALKNANYRRIGPITDDLADMAAGYGVKLCWENVSWGMFSYPSFAPELLEHCKSDKLRFTFDVKQAVRSGHDPLAYVENMGDRLAHVHLCDVRRDRTGKLAGLAMPGEGDYDFAGLAAKLRKSNYRGAAMVEVYSDLFSDPEDVLACRKRMATVMNEKEV